MVLGETEQEKYGNNLNELLSRFGIKLRNDTVQDYEHCDGAPTWILADLGGGQPRPRHGDLLARVRSACFYRATTIETSNGARVLGAHPSKRAPCPSAPLLVSSEHGNGRVVVLADSDLFGDDCISALDHEALWLNIATWAARRPAVDGPAQPPSKPVARDLVGRRRGVGRAAGSDQRAGPAAGSAGRRTLKTGRLAWTGGRRVCGGDLWCAGGVGRGVPESGSRGAGPSGVGGWRLR